MSSIQTKLFSIYIDELGNGNTISSKQFVGQQATFDILLKELLLIITSPLR
jgi:hypothetical protein